MLLSSEFLSDEFLYMADLSSTKAAKIKYCNFFGTRYVFATPRKGENYWWESKNICKISRRCCKTMHTFVSCLPQKNSVEPVL